MKERIIKMYDKDLFVVEGTVSSENLTAVISNMARQGYEVERLVRIRKGKYNIQFTKEEKRWYKEENCFA